MAKVTQLKPVAGKAAVNSLPRPIEKVRDRYLSVASSYLEDMLDGADDRLYDLAEKETDSERERYFDAMRELRELGKLPPLDNQTIILIGHNISIIGHTWAFRRWYFAKEFTIEQYIEQQTDFIMSFLKDKKE